MSEHLEYTYPSEELVQTASLTLVDGTPADGYELETIANQDPANPYKVDSTTFRIVMDFGSAVVPAIAAIIHHNFAPGLTGVVLEGAATNVWATSPPTAAAFSREFDAASYYGDDFPVNLSLDLRSASPSYRYWSLAVTDANTVPVSIGEFLMYSDVHALDGSLTLDLSPEEQEDHPIIEHPTDADVSMLYLVGYKRRSLRGGLIQTTANAQLVRDWNRATQGRALPFVVLVTTSEGSGEEPWYVRFAQSPLSRRYTYGSVAQVFDLALSEISRGLKPTPSAV